MISLISSLSLKINCTSIRWCMIETSSSLPRKSSAMFGNLQTYSENIRQRSCDFWTSFGESSEIFRKWSMVSLISSLSLKLYFNSLMYDRNIFESSSKVFGNVR